MQGKNVFTLIKTRRKALKISQANLAAALKMGKRSYQYYESGQGKLTVDLLKDICKELNLTIIIMQNEHIM